MGLLTKLLQNGSNLSAANGGSVAINPLSLATSKMHADGSNPGYSLNGSNAPLVNAQYQAYRDGAANLLPSPSRLDLNGATPPQYINNLPS